MKMNPLGNLALGKWKSATFNGKIRTTINLAKACVDALNKTNLM